MAGVKRSGEYATTQVDGLLSGLGEGNHGARVKAIKRFQEYIAAFRPDVYDDDVDIIFKGKPDVGLKGLCAWAGMPSDKHSGQLKRIASNAVSLLKWLVTIDDDEPDRESIFYSRFVCLPVAELMKIGFERHAFTGSDRSRTGNRDDAFELLFLILLDHRSSDNTEVQPVSIETFLPDESAQMLFATWRQEFAATKLKQHVTVLPTDTQSGATGRGVGSKSNRNLPTSWSQATLEEDLHLMLLEENEADIAHTIVKPVEEDETSAVVPDPLDLLDGIDLRITQASHISSFRGMRRSRRAARASFIDPLAVLMVKDNAQTSSPSSRRASLVSQLSLPFSEAGTPGAPSAETLSVLPSDKTFSPELFLTLVHSNTNFQQLSDGLKRLGDRLESQKEKRKHLVQEHYGLYVQCAEGIEWLKAEMQTQLNKLARSIPQEKAEPDAYSPTPQRKNAEQESFFEIRLQRANDLFVKAAEEARGTLRPLLDSMEKASKIKAAEQVLKRLAPLLELPLKMKEALKDGRYDDVLGILKRITSLTKNSNLNLIQQVARKAAEIGQEFRTTLVAQLLEPQTDHVVLLSKLHLLLEWQALDELQGQPKREAQQNYALQCFQHQLKHFMNQLEDIQRTNSTEMTDAFLKAREMEIEMNDQAYETGSGRGSASSTGRREGKHNRTSSGSNILRETFTNSPARRLSASMDSLAGRRSSNIRNSELGGAVVDLNLAISLLGASDDETDHAGSVTNDDIDDDDDDDVSLGINSDDVDEFAEDDSASVDTGSLTAGSSGMKRHPLADVPLAPGVDRVTHECSIVRVRLVQRVVEHLARWLPCLHSLVLEIQRSMNAESSTKIAVNRRNRWIHDTQGGAEISPEKELSHAIQTASDITRKAIMGSGNVSPTDVQRQQQNPMRRAGSASNGRWKSMLNHPVHTQGLINPYLHHAVQEVSNLFEIVESLLGRSQESPYFGAMSDLLLVTKDGEMAHAQRLIEALDQNLLTIANERLHSHHHAFIDDMPDLDDAGAPDQGRSKRAPNSLMTRCKLLQQNVSQMLLMVQETCPHLEWSADIVKNGVRSCMLHFLQALARHSAMWEQNVEGRSATGEYFSNHEDEALIPLHIVRSCYELRTNIIPTVYTDVARIFPSVYVPEDSHDDDIDDFVLVREKDTGYMTDNSDAQYSVHSRSSRVSAPTERRLSKLFGGIAQPAQPTTTMRELFEDVYRSVENLQTSAIQAFLKVQSVHVRSILNSSWLKPAAAMRMQRLRDDSRALPTQLGRILYLMITVRARVRGTLNAKANESGSSYEEQILEGVCHSISSCYDGVLSYHSKRPPSAQSPANIRLLRDLRNELFVLSEVVGQQYPSCSRKCEQQIQALDKVLPPASDEDAGSTQVDAMMSAAQIFLNALSGDE